MREGLNFQASWGYFDPHTGNGESLKVREEQWDYAKYGADGTITDEIVSELDHGFEAGWYTLILYIDDKQSWDLKCPYNVEFIIADVEDIEPLLSPDGIRYAIVERPGTLIIQEADDKQRVLVITDEISSIAWFPNGRYLIYSDRDRSEQIPHTGTIAIPEELWIVDVQTGEKNLIGMLEEGFHTPNISPNGRYIAVLYGTGWFDACFVDLGVVVLEINEELERVNTYYLSDFAGLPQGNEDTSIYPVDTEDIPIPGVWQSNSQIMVGLRWACISYDPKGVYLLDIKSLKAEKVGDLEGE